MNTSQHKKIVFLDRSTFPKNIKFNNLNFKNTWKNYNFTEKKDIGTRIREANIVVTNKVNLNKLNLNNAKNLELIAITATGTNIIDLEFCNKRNIAVCNLRDYASTSVAEHVMTLILSLSKNIKGLEEDIKNKLWQKKKVFALLSREISDLNNKNIGIIGNGSIGKKVGKFAKAFGMNISFISVRNSNKNELREFLHNLDYLSIHIPLNEKTNGLISIKELKAMKKSSIIINTARGGIITEKDLVYAIKNKIIAGAGIDVATEEPPKSNHVYYQIIKKSNFIWTPHTAWASSETLQRAIDQLINNINSFYEGKKKNLV